MDLFSDKYLPWFILKEIPQLGNRLYKNLIQRFESPEKVLTASAQEFKGLAGISSGLVQEIQSYQKYRDQALAELNLLYGHQIKIVTLSDPAYPVLLKEINDPPPFLTYVGTLDPSPCIAMVGSRNATTYGMNAAENLAHSLASNGFQVVSGMARGIDSAAHWGALKAQGKTIAVLGSGLNRIYPRENQKLFFQIREKGAVLSEFKFNSAPLPHHFPIRNRIIAGISTGTIVVEAAKKSGSLITARLAGEYNREVFAVPGSIRSTKSQGTHSLLKQGAKLVENQKDIMDELHQFIHILPPVTQEKSKKNRPLMDKDQMKVYKNLDPYPKHIDLIIQSTRMDSGLVSATLLDLELQGLVQRHPGNYFSISEA